MIDKSFYEIDLTKFYRDFILYSLVFVISFIACFYVSGMWLLITILISTSALHHAGAFTHELTHQERNKKLKQFSFIWDLTIGAILLMPSARFIKPHTLHHTTGIFATKNDPQYILVREHSWLMFLLLFVIPFIAPIYNLLLVVTASVPGVDVEKKVDDYLAKWNLQLAGELDPNHKKSVALWSRYYLVVFILYISFFSHTIWLLYTIQVLGWMLASWRIPLEHGLKKHLERSSEKDQISDSFTVESPYADFLQPLSLQFHTAHHMYPRVPYHNLPKLHRALKESNKEYRNSIVSFKTAVLGKEKQ